jgi:hypothetical protein
MDEPRRVVAACEGCRYNNPMSPGVFDSLAYMEGITITSGDYHRAFKGAPHGVARSATGAFLLRSNDPVSPLNARFPLVEARRFFCAIQK